MKKMKRLSINNDMKPIIKYKELYSEKFGRHLIAAKKVNAGEVILREMPVIVGAAAFNDNCLCFTCLRVIPKNISIADSNILCTKCHIAVFCCVACETRKSYHTIEECELFKDKIIPSILMKDILLPLRLWLIKKRDENLWKQILRLEAHLEARINTHVWNDRDESVIKPLQSLKIIDEANDDNYSELFQRLCGILDVNSFELRSPGSHDKSTLRGLYLEAALMTHDCRGNTHLTVDDDFMLTIYASKSIDENEIILFNYTSSLLGMAERREHLLVGKYFECECSMCNDPEELGTNISTIICPRCKKGSVTFQYLNVKDPHMKGSIWKCKECNNSLSGRMIKTCLDITKMRINQVEQSIEEVEALIKQLSSTYHPNHYLMLNIKQILLALNRNESSHLNPSNVILQRTIDLCNEFLVILDIVEPGISRLKGFMLYEIHMPIVILANRNYTAREITWQQLINQLEQAENYLKRSLTILLLEPVTTPEGILAKRALQEFKTLRQHRNDMMSLPPSIK